MLLSTTSTIEGKTVKEYRGVIFGEAITGINFVKDFTASITDFIGGRAEEYEQELVAARADAINEMMQRAQKIGANAIIGVSVDIETIGERGSMIIATATGTAVVIEGE